MGYSVKELSRLSGVSARTLRFYEQKGLLVPQRRENGYREYSQREVDRLQQILFFRRTGMAVGGIAALLQNPGYNAKAALENQLKKLEAELELTRKLIKNVRATLACLNGGKTMADKEKFEGLKEKLLKENEETYGAEIRGKYGADTIEKANKKFKGLSQAQLEKAEALSKEIAEGLKTAMAIGDPACEEVQKVCAAHQEWLCLYWPEGHYSKEAHKSLGQMYADDERFTAYYDRIQPSAAVFLRDALNIFCK